MNILLIEPFYAGSHKHFADQLCRHSRHAIQLLTLPGKYWKWRMYGGAITLGEQFIEGGYQPDVILVTDMLDLSVLLATVRRHLSPDVPIVCYFHENQMAYPWHPDSKDLVHERDLHYGMMNYQNALAADWNLFNSAYNMTSLYDELKAFLKKMPDYKHTPLVDDLRRKSSVMALGLELDGLVKDRADVPNEDGLTKKAPLILWNHRWEHDKNPEDFFEALLALKAKAVPFRLAVLGEQYPAMPDIFKAVPSLFEEQLVAYGYGDYDTYLHWLNETDILPVTSNHDFFGISVMEAVHCGATPLLPKRLTYPDLYDAKAHPEFFYDTQKDLIHRLTQLCQTYKSGPRDRYHYLTAKYDWSVMGPCYDDFFDTMVPEA